MRLASPLSIDRLTVDRQSIDSRSTQVKNCNKGPFQVLAYFSHRKFLSGYDLVAIQCLIATPSTVHNCLNCLIATLLFFAAEMKLVEQKQVAVQSWTVGPLHLVLWTN